MRVSVVSLPCLKHVSQHAVEGCVPKNRKAYFESILLNMRFLHVYTTTHGLVLGFTLGDVLISEHMLEYSTSVS